MRYFVDTEFNAPGAGKPIELISIGIVDDHGREFYRENQQALDLDVSPWIRANVFPHLLQSSPDFNRFDVTPVRSLKAIAGDLKAFIGDDPEPEFWGYYCAYDYVVLSQLMGGMDDWPAGWPYLMYDVRQWLDDNGMPSLTQPGSDRHHALDDARWIREARSLLVIPEVPDDESTTPSREETDLQVFCHTCEKLLGYVVKDGHKEWLCEDCTAEVTGEQRMTAVRVEHVEPSIEAQLDALNATIYHVGQDPDGRYWCRLHDRENNYLARGHGGDVMESIHNAVDAAHTLPFVVGRGDMERDDRIDGPIGDAYGRYDSDPRVNGPHDFEAFADAVESITPYVLRQMFEGFVAHQGKDL